jgi:hypothetical protein
MSWFFGRIGNNLNQTTDRSPWTGKASHVIATNSFFLALGGIKETCYYEVNRTHPDSGWAVVGLGIRITDYGTRLLKQVDWNALLWAHPEELSSLDGHFVAMKWNCEGIELFTDQLGLRTAYYATNLNEIVFSSRLDWVAQATGKSELDQNVVGSRWLLFNQLSYESGIIGIRRLGPSGHLVYRNGSVATDEHRVWTPEFGSARPHRMAKVLESIAHGALVSGNKVSLSLSGGFDSRVMLAFLIGASREKRFSVHTVGEPDNPDVRIALNIAQGLGIEAQHFNDSVPAAVDLLPAMQVFAAQNHLVEPVSSILRLGHYERLYNEKKIVVDGGFGELSRRQYLNRIARLGIIPLRAFDLSAILPLMSVQRADIFNNEYSRTLTQSTIEQIGMVLRRMPSVQDVGVGNFVDLLSVRTRVPNFGGPEQARADSFVVNFMPMAQASFLREVFKTDARFRTNGKFYRNIVHLNEQRLATFPLVKSGTTYPFSSSAAATWLITKVKNTIRTPYIDSTPVRFLLQVKEFVMDLASSVETQTWHGYDGKKNRQVIESFYKSDYRLSKHVDWWLTFELWRRSFSGGIRF